MGVSCGSGLVCTKAAGLTSRCTACKTSTQSCSGLGQGNCCSGMVCDFLGECRNQPGKVGELCGLGVACEGGLRCVLQSNLQSRCERCDQRLEGCSGLGQGTCCDDLVCDISGTCRHNPPQADEPCGVGVNCCCGLVCNAVIGGTCELCGQGKDDCIGLGQGSCCEGLLCDFSGKCRNVPSELGEPCGAGVPCTEPNSCSAIIGGVCEACGRPGDGCFGLGNGTCCRDDGEDAGNPLLCDFTGECRHSRPTEGEPCGVGVPCNGDALFCDALAGGRCVVSGQDRCARLSADCAPQGEVCDFLCGECRAEPGTQGQVCGLDDFFGPDCAPDLTCRLALPCSRCDPARGIGQSCFSTTNCADGLQCWPFEQVCYPEGGEDLFPDEVCLGMYSPEKHLSASALGVAVAYSTASVASVGVSGTVELGAVYGPAGEYGCFITRCTGAEISVGVASSACLAIYNDYESVIGLSTEIVESVGPGTGAQFSTSQILNTSGGLIGTADCFSIEASVSPPFTVGAYACDTIVDTMFGRFTTLSPSSFAGDTDGSGKVLATDALLSLKTAVGNELRCPKCVCDLNGSGRVTATDSLMTLQLGLGIEVTTFNSECLTPPTTTAIEMPQLQRLRELQRQAAP